jgi:DNA-binding LacI/PurR family transcriptional regulator
MLHARGHRQIAHVTIPGYDNPEPLNPQRFAHLRYQGYRRAMAELRLQEQVIPLVGQIVDLDMQFEGGVEAGGRIAQRGAARPSAIVAFNDFVAAGLMSGLARAGVAVPHDVSIVSVGEQPFDKMLNPPLTTISRPYEQMAALATQSLLQLIEGQEVPPTAALPTKLIERGSVASISPR